MVAATGFSFRGHGGPEKNKGRNYRLKEGETPRCDFCGAIADQSIEHVNGRIVLACFVCIPERCRFKWINMSIKLWR